MDMECKMFAKVVVQSKVMNVSMYRCFDFDLCVHSNDKSGTPMTNIWLVTQWALAAQLYNDN